MAEGVLHPSRDDAATDLGVLERDPALHSGRQHSTAQGEVVVSFTVTGLAAVEWLPPTGT
ncbi:hypothetical protein ACFZCY_03890 [Streptomyces sp. NPDC007983]|uniref:hypothetical protein n=1 Tax=Streptomyces sp. NPDC007983 TaxID=3364800 RepID=UPI0036E26BED